MTPSSPHIWIVHCPAGGGHRAAAQALRERADLVGARAEVIDALSFTPSWFAKSYVQTHLKSTQHAPWAYGLGYEHLNRRSPPLDAVRRRVDALVGRRLLDAVGWAQPDIIIGTHFFPLSVFGRARRKGRLHTPVIGVITDYTAHAFWVEPGVDRYCAAGRARAELVRHGASPARVASTGIPIRAGFGAIAELSAGELAPTSTEPLRVLVTSGGFGIGPLEEALRSFRGLPGFELTIVCGADERRRARVTEVARACALDAHVVGFERDMPARMSRAHVVLGKAGGLTVSEALAAGRPMALMGICPGQEAQNQAWLERGGAAVTVAPEHAGAQLHALRGSGALVHMARAARRLGAPDAAASVLDIALGSQSVAWAA